MTAWAGCTGFDWDAGNSNKKWRKHRVSDDECEEVFLNRPLIVRADQPHPAIEPRHYALGQNDRGRPLFVAFTVRQTLIRVISAREMNRNELRIYAIYEEDEKEGAAEV